MTDSLQENALKAISKKASSKKGNKKGDQKSKNKKELKKKLSEMPAEEIEEVTDRMTHTSFMFFSLLHAQKTRYLRLHAVLRNMKEPNITRDKYDFLLSQ